MLRLRAADRMQRAAAAGARNTQRQLLARPLPYAHSLQQPLQRSLHTAPPSWRSAAAAVSADNAGANGAGSAPSFASFTDASASADRPNPSPRSFRPSQAHTLAARVRESLLREVEPLPLWDRSFIVRRADEKWNRAPRGQDGVGASSGAHAAALGVSPRLHGYLTDMHAALRAGHTDHVFALFARAQADPLVGKLHVELFNVLIMACLKLKQPQASIATFDAIFEHNLEPDFVTYITVVDSMLDHNDFAIAFDLLHLLHQQFRSAIADQRRFEAPNAPRVDENEEASEAARIYANAAELWSPEELALGLHTESQPEAQDRRRGSHTAESAKLAAFEFAVPGVDSSAAEWWMHSQVLNLHARFLRMVERIGRGAQGPSQRSWRVRHVFEPFLMRYLQHGCEAIEAQLHAVLRADHAERAQGGFAWDGRNDAAAGAVGADVNEPNNTSTGVSVGFAGLAPSQLQWAYRTAIDIRQSLLSHAIARGSLTRAAVQWTELEAFRRKEGVAQLWGRKMLTLGKDTSQLQYFKHALSSLVQVQHGLRALDPPAPAAAAVFQSGTGRTEKRDPGAFRGAGHLHSVEDFRATTLEVYADFWRYLQHLLVAKRAPASAAGALGEATGASNTDVFALASFAGGAGMIPESAVEVAARLAAEEPPEALDQAQERAAVAAAALRERIHAAGPGASTDANTDTDNSTDMFSLIESAARHALKSEAVLQGIEGPSPEGELVAAELDAIRPFREEEDEVLAAERIEGSLDAPVEMDVLGGGGNGDAAMDDLMDPLASVARSVDPDGTVEAVADAGAAAGGADERGHASAVEALDQQFRHGLSEANSALASSEGGSAPAQQSQPRSRATLPLESVASLRPGSLLPPHTAPVLREESIRVINYIYERLISTLLLYGAASPARVVTPRSYRQNRELIHALYTDYMSLPLAPASTDVRIVMLAHISHAPAEFHATLLRDGLGGADGSGGGFASASLMDLFKPVFRAQPMGSLRRMWSHYSARHAGAVPVHPPAEGDAKANLKAPHIVPDSAVATAALRSQSHATLDAAQYPTQLELAAERAQHFQEVWNAHHVSHGLLYPAGGDSPPGALAAGAFAAEASDLAFRRRSYRLVEELARRGVAPQSPSEPLLHLLIRSLAFTSYSSRYDPSAEDGAPGSRNILGLSFKERMREVYPLQLLHVKRVLRVLFGMMLRSGAFPDVPTLNVLVSACLAHRCYAEAHTVLHHMRHTFHLVPDASTLNLFLQHGHTVRNPKYAAGVLRDIECALNELVSAGAGESGDAKRTVAEEMKDLRVLNQMRRSSGGASASAVLSASGSGLSRALNARGMRLLDPQLQLQASFNKLLSHYRFAKDAAGMLRVHERMFELGLRPDSHTLALSIEILLLAGNVGAYRTALELLEHALSPRPMPLEPGGNLQSFVLGVEAGRKAAKESIRAARHNEALQREEDLAGSALTESSPSSATSTAAAAAGMAAPFDPTASSSGSSIAISFSYESWFDLHVTSRSWRRVIEAASDLGLWDDTWQLFQRMMRHLVSLPEADPRSTLFMSEHRWFIVRAVFRALLHHASHLDPRVQAWHMDRLLTQLRPFASVDYAAPLVAVEQDGMTAIVERMQRRPTTNVTLDHPKLQMLMLPSEMAALRTLAEAARTGRVKAPKGDVDAAAEPIVLPTPDALRARRDAATAAAAENMIDLQRKHKMAMDAESGDMSFL